jgi:hypothetical protein
VSQVGTGKLSFEPNTYYGVIQNSVYTCVKCKSGCSSDKYQSRWCTHARINKDFCNEAHPISAALAEKLPIAGLFPTTVDKILQYRSSTVSIPASVWSTVDQTVTFNGIPATTVGQLYSQCYDDPTSSATGVAHVYRSFRNDNIYSNAVGDNLGEYYQSNPGPTFGVLNGISLTNELFSDSNTACSEFRPCGCGEFRLRGKSSTANFQCKAKSTPTDDQWVPKFATCASKVCGTDRKPCKDTGDATSDLLWADWKLLQHAPMWISKGECVNGLNVWQSDGTGTETSDYTYKECENCPVRVDSNLESDRIIATRTVCKSCEWCVSRTPCSPS